MRARMLYLLLLFVGCSIPGRVDVTLRVEHPLSDGTTTSASATYSKGAIQ